MSKDTFDAVLASVPQGAVAGRVTARGTHYEPRMNPTPATHYHADVPPPLKRCPNPAAAQRMIGKKFGRFTVIGYCAKQNPKKPAKWAVRCACGQYEVRGAGAINNPANAEIDRCRVCRDFQYKQRAYRELGSRPIGDFFVSVLKPDAAAGDA